MIAPGITRGNRVGIGVELKPSYYVQAVRNMSAVDDEAEVTQAPLIEAWSFS